MDSEKPPQPPRWISRLLARYCDPRKLESIEGDLMELFERQIANGKLRQARWNYHRNALGFLRRAIFNKQPKITKNPTYMFRNYLKIALRNLRRDTFYSILNLSGLTIGIAACLMIFLYVHQERNYDRHHRKADRIFRVAADLQTPDQLFQFALGPPDLAPALKEDFPEIEQYTRFLKTSGLLEYGEQRFQENSGVWVDSTVFEVFDLPVVSGQAKAALDEPFSIVLSKTLAKKFFGDSDPVGQSMTYANATQPVVVRAVIEDIPEQSHFKFDFMLSFNTLDVMNPPTGNRWFFVSYYTYLLLQDESHAPKLQDALPKFVERRFGTIEKNANQSYTFQLQPLTDIHLHSHREVEWENNGHATTLTTFSFIAVFILLIACINFTNLVTARSARRAREIGLRKVVGAGRRQIMTQFLAESSLMSMIAVLLSLGLTAVLLPAFNQLAGTQITLDLLFENRLWLWLPGIGVVVGLLAGAYPAFLLSGFRPYLVLKGIFARSRQGTALQHGLTVFQLTISMILIVATIVIFQQWRFLQHQSLGFDREQMLVLNFRFDKRVQEEWKSLKEALNRPAGVVSVAASANTPDVTPGNFYLEYEKEEGQTQNSSMHGYMVDFNFFDTYQLELLEGRAFSPEFARDSAEAFILNEAAVTYLGWTSPQEAIGKRFFQFGKEGRIIGVVRDFNFRSLFEKIEPLAIQIGRQQNLSRFSIKVDAPDLSGTLAAIRRIWEDKVPYRPFEFAFLDDSLQSQYEKQEKTGQLIGAFSILALFISALGLIGLASYLAQREKKNIGIRKVLGATLGQIALLFSGRFARLALLAFVIAVPISYLSIRSWLQSFPYRLELGVTPFIWAGLGMVLVTYLSVSIPSMKAARTNPADQLRRE